MTPTHATTRRYSILFLGVVVFGVVAAVFAFTLLLGPVSSSDGTTTTRRRLVTTAPWSASNYIQRIRGKSDLVIELSHSTTNNIPTYVGICAALLDTIDGLRVKRKAIREGKLVCGGRLGIFESLQRIMISSFLVAQGRAHFGLRIDYVHGCGRFENTFLQSALPSKMTLNTRYTATERDQAVLFCSNLMLNPNEADHEQLQAIFSRQVPMIRENIQVAMEAISKKKGSVPQIGIISTLEHRQPSVVEETAAIYLPCIDQLCSNVLVVPYHVYLTNIPRSVRSIDVVVPPECQGNYREHALDLIGTLRKFNPLVAVELIEGYPLQVHVFSRLMLADYVLCGPGWGKACVYPLLAQPTQVPGKFRIMDPETVEFLDGMTSPIPIQYDIVKSIPPQSFKFLQSLPEGFRHFAYSQPDPQSCKLLRGRYGQWVQDLEYAKSVAQYHTPLLHMSGASDRQYRELHPGQVRPATTYKWEETLFPSCGVSHITREGFCSVMHAHGIRRLFLLGDSLSLQMGLSLWMLLRPESDIPLDDESSMRRVIPCPAFDFVIQFVRNDELLENSRPVSLQKQVKNCHHFCYPWRAAYANDPSKTLLVVNTGSHLHSRELFNQALPRFFSEFDSLNRPDDRVLLRTLVPGHKNCGRPGLVPFKGFDEYANDVNGQTVKDTYNWNVLSSYNALLAKFVDDRKRNSASLNGAVANIDLLDIFPATVLRPDGHMADEFKVTETPKTDCLHYSAPGPVDYWNHLLFTQMKFI